MRVKERERIESSASARYFSASEEPHVNDNTPNASQNIGGGNGMMGISVDPLNISQKIIGGEATMDVVKPKEIRRHSEGDIRREDGDGDGGGLMNSERGEKFQKKTKKEVDLPEVKK